MELSITITAKGSKFAPIVLCGDYVEQIELAAKIGYKAVELHIQDPNRIDQEAIFEALQKNKMRVSTIGTGQAYVDERLSFSNPDHAIRQRAVQRIKDQIKFARELKAKVIIGTIKGLMPEDPRDRVIAKEHVINCLKECAAYAKEHDTLLTLEAVNRYETNFLNNAQETMELIDLVDSPNLGLHLDTFHMNIEEVSIEETLRKYRDYLFHIHLADSNRRAPGMGHLDFRSIYKTLREIDYQEFLGLEYLPEPEPIIAAKQGLTYFRSLIQ